MHSVRHVTYDRLLWGGLIVFIYSACSSTKVHSFVNQSYNRIRRLEDTSQTQKCDIQTDWQMNRQIYNTHMYLFNKCGCEQKTSVQSFHYHFCSFITIYIHVSYQSSEKKVAHVMSRLTCYMHVCVHVVLIILIWINRNMLVWAIDQLEKAMKHLMFNIYYT